MTPVREAFVLPLVFLTVVLLGGLHLTTPVAIGPPSLFSLVLASLLLGVLVQTGTLDPVRLMHSGRSPLANVNGLVVLITAFMATAQMLSLMTPASGLPSLALNLFFVGIAAVMQWYAGGTIDVTNSAAVRLALMAAAAGLGGVLLLRLIGQQGYCY